MDTETKLASEDKKPEAISQKPLELTQSDKSSASRRSSKKSKKEIKKAKKTAVKAAQKDKEEAEDEKGVFGSDGKEEAASTDPYNSEDMSSDELKSIDSFAEEEKKAFASPLKTSEMKKMEASGDSLFKEITAGLKGVSDAEYQKAKKFFGTGDDDGE